MYEKPQVKKSKSKDFSVSISIRQLSIIVMIAFLTACSSKPRTPGTQQPMAAEQRQQQLAAMQQFTVQATMSIKSPAESVTGNLRWQQLNQNEYQARLTNSLLGISLFELSQDLELTELRVRGERYQAANASSLLWQLAGWSIPLHDMALWLRGLPGDSATALQYDQAGHLTSFELLDSTGIRWRLSYRSFFDDALSLPRQLHLQSDDTQIRVVIRSWQQ
ncbi:Outer-membrane lipoprotein LolB [Alishewanella longhuensis]